MSQAKEKLMELSQRLKGCPSLDTSINPKLFRETWNAFREINLDQGDEITTAVITAVILYDPEVFNPLLDEAELSLLNTIARSALERYQTRTNPLNQPGKLLGNCIAATNCVRATI